MRKLMKWSFGIFFSSVFLAAALLGYHLDRVERMRSEMNAYLLRGDVALADAVVAKEEQFWLRRSRDYLLPMFRDGKIEFLRCRVAYGRERFMEAREKCNEAAGLVRADEEKFSAFYYAALSAYHIGFTLDGGRGSWTQAIRFLTEALKVRQDGEAQALLAALLEAKAEQDQVLVDKKQIGKKGQREIPALFDDGVTGGAGSRKKGF